LAKSKKGPSLAVVELRFLQANQRVSVGTMPAFFSYAFRSFTSFFGGVLNKKNSLC
jgi:hypothetical protein